MSNYTISIFGSKIFYEILNELTLFAKSEIKYFENFNEFHDKSRTKNQIVIYFINNLDKNNFEKIKENNYPMLLIGNSSDFQNFSEEHEDFMNVPFSIQDFEKKIIITIAKYSFKKNSFINLNDYIIDKNERKIKKNNLELQLSEKEIDFLILFSEHENPIKRDLVLEKVWNYSQETETHTVETHIHRLRKKILEKFDDNDFIKNNKKGYFI